MNLNEIKNQILNELSSLNDQKKNIIIKQLSVLELTNGLKNVNNLENFYSIWKKNKGKNKGTKNTLQSWTAFYLGLTSVEPEQGKEFLPSFRSYSRVGFPDIDSDFDYFKRDEIYDYVKNKYGHANVANVGTNQALKLKATVRRLGKALDIAGAYHKGPEAFTTQNEAKVTQIIQSLPPQKGAKLTVSLEDGTEVEIKTIEDACKYCEDFKKYMDKYPAIRQNAKVLQGVTAGGSVHPAGICISSVPFEQIAPLRATRKGLATMYHYEELQSMGIIKFDILALSTLTVVKECMKLIYKNHGIKIDLNEIPKDDQKTLQLYRNGLTNGVFQCESYGMQQTLKDMETSHFNDVMAALAMFRPGPMASIPDYCAIKRGQKKADYLHPLIEKYIKPILHNTYGLLCYQQQIMLICQRLGGMTPTEGYDIIKGIGKKKMDLIANGKKKFIEGCSKNGVPQEIADKYWEHYIVPFANYGFNLSHAASYAVLSFTTAYLKTHYTEEFFISQLNVENYRKKAEKVISIQRDAKKFDIEFLQKDINKCGVDYTLEKRKDKSKGVFKSYIRPSLVVKGMGTETGQNLVKNRPYKDMRDIAFKTDHSIVSKDTIGCLVDGGFYDELFKLNKQKDKTLTKQKFREMAMQKFVALRKEAKQAIKKGIGTESLFD